MEYVELVIGGMILTSTPMVCALIIIAKDLRNHEACQPAEEDKDGS